MIRIKKLSLKNFKSFRKADIPLSDGFTAIVGSNGSGKSNILDSILFVLGISSLKSLRASRLTDLVNNDSREEYAKVELELEDAVQNKNWLISRTVDKNGKSQVRLDEKKVTLNEVTSLLNELGLDAQGHNIVVQGDITSIVEMNDTGRREMIDEIAGIREFDEKRTEAFRELEKVEQRIKEVRIVLAERTAYLEQLAKEREAALLHNSLLEEVKQTKATLLAVELETIQKKREKNKVDREKLQADFGVKNRKKSETIAELDELSGQIEALNKELLDSREKTFSGIGLLAEEKKSEKKVREERMLSKKEQTEKNNGLEKLLVDRNDQIDSELVEKKELLKKVGIELDEIEGRLLELRKKQSEIKSEWQSKNKELSEFESDLEQKETALSELQSRFFSEQASQKTIQKTVDLKRQFQKEALQELNRIKDRHSGLEAKKETLESLLSGHPRPSEQIKRVLDSLSETEKQISYWESTKDHLQKHMDALEKAAATCPVCEQSVSLETKKNAVGQKKAEFKKAVLQIESLKEKTKKLFGQKSELESIQKKVQELQVELGGFSESVSRISDLESKTSVLEKEICEMEKKRDSIGLERLEAELQKSRALFDETEQSVSGFKKQLDARTLAALSEEIEGISRKLNEKKGYQKELELSASMLLSEEKKQNIGRIRVLQGENQALANQLLAEEKAIAALEKELSHLELELAKAEKESRGLVEKKERDLQKQSELKERVFREEYSLRSIEKTQNELAIDDSKHEVREADLKEESVVFAGVVLLENRDLHLLRERIFELDKKISKMGAINQKAVMDFGEHELEMLEIKKKSDKLEEERLAVLDMIQKIEDRRTGIFMDCFNAVNRNFNHVFFTLAEGQGKLSLSNPENPLEAGLLIEASLKNKPIYSMDSMSGGEKTLTALAFLFAIQMYNPAPFYVFDEADAALDKENSVRLGKIIREISQKSQFIGITHNDTIVREANQIIGVALNEQKSSVIGLKLKAQAADSESEEG
ncbi:MAG: AAA family ATPase [Candidatus Micrarchaeota archaeon]